MSDFAGGVKIGNAGGPTDGPPAAPIQNMRRLRLARALGVAALLLGAAMLLGSRLSTTSAFAGWLNSLQPPDPAVFVLAGAALALAPTMQRLASIVAVPILLIATLYLVMNVAGGGFGVTLLLSGTSRLTLHPDYLPMPPFTALGLLLFAAAVLLRRWPDRPVASFTVRFAAFTGLLLSTIALIDWLVTTIAPRIVHPPAHAGLLDSIELLVLFVGVVSLAADRTWLSPMLDGGEAGVLARRLVPIMILGPLAVDWLTLHGTAIDWYDPGAVPVLGALVNMALLCGIVQHATVRLRSALGTRAELIATREAAALAEAEFRTSFEHSAVGKLLVDPADGHILRTNATFARSLIHDEPAALNGVSFWTLIHPDHRDADRGMFSELLRGATNQALCETRQLRRDGSVIWVRMSATLLRDDRNGTPLCLMVDVEDVNARHAAEHELHDVAARFRRIFEDNPIGIVVADAADGSVLAANPAFCQMLEYTGDEVLGRTRDELTHPDDRQVGEEQRHALSETPATYEKRLVTKSGRTVLARVHIASLDLPDSEHHLLLAMIEDITAVRETEDELRHAQRLETIGRLTGGIAHDFNNLLGIIIGNVEVLHEVVQDDPIKAELTTAILETATGGADLTRRLLAFARRQPLQPTVFDLNTVVATQVRLLQRTLGERVHTVTSLARGLRPVLADPSQVGDALLNLAINARDAMPNGGIVTIETGNASFGADQVDSAVSAGDYVMLLVADTGVGMPPDILEHAMTPFFTTKPPGSGSGLGLSMIYGYAKQSGGHLLIDSEIGLGTTVRLYLPAAPEGAEVAPAPVRIATLRGKERVMVLDDNAEMSNVAARHLRSLGYEVRQADTPAAVLAALRSGERFDLLLTDLVMPGVMSGDQLAAAARRLQPDLAVLFTTGYAAARSGNDGREPDPTGPIIHKPFRRHELAEKIRDVLRKQ